jgi:hypothetical protein
MLIGPRAPSMLSATVAALRSAAGALKPGGRLLLESATVAESLLPEFRSELEYEAGDHAG